MKYLRLISLFLIFIGCNSPNEELTKSFNNHLTNEQIGLIIQINKDYDEFLFQKFPEANNSVKKAYRLLSEAVAKQAAYDGYMLPTDKLNSIQNELIETGFYKELYLDSEEEFRINYEGQYLKCLEELGKNDKDFKNYYEAIINAGTRPSAIIASNAYTHLSNENQMDSMKKLLLTFDFILSQIEMEANSKKS